MIYGQCFAWSIIVALYPAENHTEWKSLYPLYTSVLNLKDTEFPLNQIKKFKNLNISINVYCIEKKKKELSIFPIRLTNKKMEKH